MYVRRPHIPEPNKHSCMFDSFTPGRCDCNFRSVIFKPILGIDILSTCCEIDLSDAMKPHWYWSTLVPVFLLGLCDFKFQRHEIWKICCKLYQNILYWDLTPAIFQVPPLIFQVFSYGGHGEQKHCCAVNGLVTSANKPLSEPILTPPVLGHHMASLARLSHNELIWHFLPPSYIFILCW